MQRAQQGACSALCIGRVGAGPGGFALLHHHGVEGRVQPIHAGEKVFQRLARTQRAGGDLPGQ